MRTIILAVAVASVSVIGALASLPPAEELTRGEFIWSEKGKTEPDSMQLCSLPTPGPNIAMPTIEIYKSSRLHATHSPNR
ncbi:hypothetical protein [Rhizobium sp. AAP43]|uniref:hypothetical protein n=1 Tax=Rhizobium sp. AAP43 TaxID=1523420 RepID=UPI0006B8BBBF|nr:hypothetical protein [Rhizobium sp. AAP43]KPF43640.1 hypothetical protein IP76_13465 [Rhizobium sp. AAP43]